MITPTLTERLTAIRRDVRDLIFELPMDGDPFASGYDLWNAVEYLDRAIDRVADQETVIALRASLAQRIAEGLTSLR